MCHWIREPGFERERSQPALPPFELPKLRPRLVGAVAAVVAIVATAAVLMFPSPTPAVSTPQAAAPLAPAVEQTSSGLDDGVPATTVSKAGGCAHDF